ncbi:MAG: preprotein translocase subunit SecE [Erysipelotrichaceae bacterium]|nr:preprotein translocase subunit SecE [Erysipelotrichaceae bacterium]
MLKWFSLSGISKEIKRIRWPKVKDITEHTGEVLLFVFAFGAFFIASDLIITGILKLIGIGA